MVAFDLTDEQRELRDLAHRFAEQEIRSIAADCDEREEVPWEVIGKAAQAGFFSYFIPEKYGGGGITDTLTHCLVDEELFWGCAGVGTIIGGCSLCATPILLAGNESQKTRYLARFCDPQRPALGAFALTEPAAGSDPASLTTQARRVGDQYVINFALKYAQERVQFDRPIIQHQAVAFMLADMATQIEAARLLCWRAATLADQGVPCTLQASMAKAFAADVAMRVTTDAVQILGGYGYMRDFPVEKWMRDAKIMQIYEGTAQIQRLIIARHLIQV